jgi:hypothetical protein
VALLALAGYGLYRWLAPRDEAAIRGVLDQVAATASFQPGEGNFARMKAVSDLMGLFTTDVTLSLDGVPNEARDIQGAAALRELVVAARLRLQSAQVTFSDVFVELGPGRETAVARLIGRAQFSGMDQPWYQELKVDLRKADGSCKIAQVGAAKGLTM